GGPDERRRVQEWCAVLIVEASRIDIDRYTRHDVGKYAAVEPRSGSADRSAQPQGIARTVLFDAGYGPVAHECVHHASALQEFLSLTERKLINFGELEIVRVIEIGRTTRQATVVNVLNRLAGSVRQRFTVDIAEQKIDPVRHT